VENSKSDLDLQSCLNRIRDGDVASRNELFERTAARFEELARRMFVGFPIARIEADTGDLLQSASVRLLRMLNEFVPETPADLMRLATLQMRRELIDLSRRIRGGPIEAAKPQHSDWLEPASGRSTLNPFRLAEWTEFHERVSELPDELRTVFDLLWYQGVSQAEAASLLNVHERTVQRRWREARLILQQAIESG
jgi:RNA polymerase sigma-70 factor (ECF subfamily)